MNDLPNRRNAMATLFALGTGAALTGLPCRPSLAQASAAELKDLDVPFVVTPDNVVLRMLDIAQVSAHDVVYDLGSGDGRIVITAALRYGAQGYGVEIDPSLVSRAQSNAVRAGVSSRARFETRDLFETDFGPASVITMYLLPDVNIQLRPKLLRLRPGVRLVSHDWDMGDWQPDHDEVIDAPEKSMGLQKKARLMLWVVPVQLNGRHSAGGANLEIVQRYQNIESARLILDTETISLSPARVRGPAVLLTGRDANGRAATLSATVPLQPSAGSRISWHLRRNRAPDRTFETIREP